MICSATGSDMRQRILDVERRWIVLLSTINGWDVIFGLDVRRRWVYWTSKEMSERWSDFRRSLLRGWKTLKIRMEELWYSDSSFLINESCIYKACQLGRPERHRHKSILHCAAAADWLDWPVAAMPVLVIKVSWTEVGLWYATSPYLSTFSQRVSDFPGVPSTGNKATSSVSRFPYHFSYTEKRVSLYRASKRDHCTFHVSFFCITRRSEPPSSSSSQVYYRIWSFTTIFLEALRYIVGCIQLATTLIGILSSLWYTQ